MANTESAKTVSQTPQSLMNASIESLSRHAPFDKMDRTHLEFMVKNLSVGYYAKDSVILSHEQGEPEKFFVIKQGMVLAEQDIASAQDDDAFWELAEGESFPLGALLSKRAVSSVYKAREDTFLYELSSGNFRKLIEMSPQFHDFCTRRLANLLEHSKNIIQAHFARTSSEQQSMNSPLRAIIRHKPVSCPPETPMRSVLETMRVLGIGSMIVTGDDGAPIGIFTLHDLLNRVALAQRDLSSPISSVMSGNLTTLPPEAFAYEAALLMTRRGIRHVIIVEGGKLAGIVSEKDLFSLQRVGLRQVSSTIRNAPSIESLKQSCSDIRELARNMMAQGVAAEQIMQFVSTLNDLLTTRVVELECEKSSLAHTELCKTGFLWIALGSEGRYEQTLNTDQDNGIIFTAHKGVSPDEIREILLPVARRVNESLNALSFPLCAGGVMAGNPQWLLSLDEWKTKFAEWIDHGDPEALLNAAIFFDFRPICGNHTLADELRKWLTAKAQSNPRFLHQMAANALKNRPPLGFVRDFVVEQREGKKNALNLKLNGVTPFVDAARIYSLAAGVEATSTASRLRSAGATLKIPQIEVEAWISAFMFIQILRLRQQHISDIPDNYIDPEELNGLDRRILKESFRQARRLQTRLAMDYNL